MSLPPGFLDELRDRLSLGQVVGRKVMWDTRKSNQGKGDLWAPCPFHQEKTASFHVDDRKGYYYCFGCHAKGDAISFVRETENVSFMEAIQILAGEAGMPMPERDPRAQAKADKRTQLAEVMDMAVQHFRLQLRTGAASEARAYLDRRGLNEAAQDRWEIGFAPDAWQGLWDHLKSKGVDDALILGAGLAKPSQKGGKPYDTFRGRIIFPIRDARGRCTAFGGRAMDPGDNAKYLNSPETELFDKGRSLYNHGPARTAAGKGQPLIVAEGYMDVIALSEYGFEAAVAPLGTAVTETQLQMLWRIAPEPIIALDGDTAGLRAAMRLIDLALPLLEAGQSLRFAMMPEGQDPDDLLKAQGAPALQKLLDGALPMVRLLWQRETEGRVFDSPERKAALEKSLNDHVSKIKDQLIAKNYRQALNDLRWQEFSTWKKRSSGARAYQTGASMLVSPDAKRSYLADQNAEFITQEVREAAILALSMESPEACVAQIHMFETLDFVGPFHNQIKAALLPIVSECVGVTGRLRRKLEDTVGKDALDRVFSYSHVRLVIDILEPNNPTAAAKAIAHEFRKVHAERGLERELAEAREDIMYHDVDEGLTWRLRQVKEEYDASLLIGEEQGAEVKVGPNGVRMDSEERNSLDDAIEKALGKRPSDK